MSTLLEDNITHLWERMPALAERVESWLGQPLEPVHWETGPQLRAWLTGMESSLEPGQLPVFLGLGPHLAAWMGVYPGRVWALEPSQDRVLHFLSRYSIQPLLLRGRLLAGETPAQCLDALFSQRRMAIIRSPGLSDAQRTWFSELEGLLAARVAEVEAERTKATAGALLARAGDGPLAELLSGMPADQVVTVEGLLAAWREGGSRAARTGRVLATLNVFR